MNEHHIARIMKSFLVNPYRWIYGGQDTYRGLCTAYTNVCKNEEIQILKNQLSAKGMSLIAQSAILCLTAHEESGYMIDSDLDELKLLYMLDDQRAILMYHACRILKKETAV